MFVYQHFIIEKLCFGVPVYVVAPPRRASKMNHTASDAGLYKNPHFNLLLVSSIVAEANAGPERGFSQVTRLTRGRRSQMNATTIDALPCTNLLFP